MKSFAKISLKSNRFSTKFGRGRFDIPFKVNYVRSAEPDTRYDVMRK
jgi:hypothetical protein